MTFRTLHRSSASRPYRLDAEEETRYLSEAQSRALYQRILDMVTTGGHTSVNIGSQWTGNLRWARNRPTTSGDTTDVTLQITRDIRGAGGTVETNKLDDESLKLAIASAERIVGFHVERLDALPPPGAQHYLHPDIWSSATYALDAAARSTSARALVAPAAQEQLWSAGYTQVGVNTRALYNTRGMNAYYAETAAECSITVRSQDGTGSGWAGTSNMDWARIDAAALAARAQRGCLNSANPRAIEPGRYTVILQPQAVHDLFYAVITSLDRVLAEEMQSVFTLRPGQSKIGLRVLDERLTISTDPMDPECGYIPFDVRGYPYRAVTWIEHGVLKQLAYDRQYALARIGDGVPLPNPLAYRVAGGAASLDDMVADTKRGLLVTRFSDVMVLDVPSLQSSGVTRDGLWLIENGKITMSVKNMRFIDSPMFAFNNVEQVGTPVRVYAKHPAIVPPIKVRDFNLAMMSDAV
jgi:predicted Zn-dependent protease